MKTTLWAYAAVVLSLCGTPGLRAQQASQPPNDDQSTSETVTANAPTVGGSGTTGFIARWISSTNLGNSAIFQQGSNIGVGTQTPAAKLDVNGTGKFHGAVTFASGQKFPGTASLGANTFAATQTISSGDLSISGGNLDIPQTTGPRVGVVNLGGSPFLHECCLTGGGNMFIGDRAGNFTTTGTQNTAIGQESSRSVTTGRSNTAVGAFSMIGNQTGQNNVAVGTSALYGGSGSSNIAVGNSTLILNSTGNNNIAVGDSAMNNNTSGNDNVAVGYQSLIGNTTGFGNVGVGFVSLASNPVGTGNTAVGAATLNYLTSGSSNIAIGYFSGNQLATGDNNIYLGNDQGSGSGTVNESNVIRIGQSQTSAFIAGINGANLSGGGTTVLVDANGQLGTVSSSQRYKEDIHAMGTASEGLLRLRPVAFRYRQPAADGSKPIQYGLIAEEVAEVYPDLVVRGKDGQVETVQYWKLDAMLLNELQKLSKANAADQERIGELLAKTEKLQSQVAEQQKQIASRARVSDSEQGDVAQLRAELNRLAAAVAANERLSVSAIATAPVTAIGDVVKQ